jgi:hypothetical protein
VFDADLTRFIEAGTSTIVAVVAPGGAPYATRGWGTDVLPGEPPRVRLLVGAAAMAAVGRAPGDGASFAIALTSADVRTLRSVQLKGTAHDLEPATPEDLVRSKRFCVAFFRDILDVDGIAPELMQRLVPDDLLACTVDVTEGYDQTPGPGAGAPLREGRA